MGKSETVNRRAYNGERKKEGKKRTKSYKTIQRNLKIEQREPDKSVVNSGGQECFTSGDRDELRRSGLLNVK